MNPAIREQGKLSEVLQAGGRLPGPREGMAGYDVDVAEYILRTLARHGTVVPESLPPGEIPEIFWRLARGEGIQDVPEAFLAFVRGSGASSPAQPPEPIFRRIPGGLEEGLPPGYGEALQWLSGLIKAAPFVPAPSAPESAPRTVSLDPAALDAITQRIQAAFPREARASESPSAPESAPRTVSLDPAALEAITQRIQAALPREARASESPSAPESAPRTVSLDPAALEAITQRIQAALPREAHASESPFSQEGFLKALVASLSPLVEHMPRTVSLDPAAFEAIIQRIQSAGIAPAPARFAVRDRETLPDPVPAPPVRRRIAVDDIAGMLDHVLGR